MQLGTFSLSLSVKDINKSKLFYEKLGFELFSGDQSQNWLIMKNNGITIGLFQGMFDENIMTFNPGWNKDCSKLDSFLDIRKLHKQFKSDDIEIESESIKDDSGPASFTIKDPDGNAIMFDQHV